MKEPVHRVSGSVSVTGSGCKPVNSDVCGVEGDQDEGGGFGTVVLCDGDQGPANQETW